MNEPVRRSERMRVRLLRTVLLTACLSFPSCASLPLPDTAHQSLVVVPFDSIPAFNDPNNNWKRTILTKLEIALFDLDFGAHRKYVMYAGSKYVYFAFYPGRYIVEGVTAYLDADGKYSDRKIAWQTTPFTVGEKTVTLLPFELSVIRRDPGGIMLTSTYRRKAGSEILGELKRLPEWEAWEGYTLVNFE